LCIQSSYFLHKKLTIYSTFLKTIRCREFNDLNSSWWKVLINCNNQWDMRMTMTVDQKGFGKKWPVCAEENHE
jgi:hypothetical protein